MFRKKRKWKFIILALVVVIVGLGVAKGIQYSETPEFCNLCHIMNPAHRSWQDAPHHESAECFDCHADPGFVGFVTAKLQGTKELFIYITQDVTAEDISGVTVPDPRCQQCHKEINEQKEFETVVIPHSQHSELSCQNCHGGTAHARGEKYFEEYPKEADMSLCQDCHNGDKAFASADCNRCHQPKEGKQIIAVTEPSDCLQCHTAEFEDSSKDIQFSHGSHVDFGFGCFSCHPQIKDVDHLEATTTELSHDSCISCHEDDISAEGDCSKCHTNF